MTACNNMWVLKENIQGGKMNKTKSLIPMYAILLVAKLANSQLFPDDIKALEKNNS